MRASLSVHTNVVADKRSKAQDAREAYVPREYFKLLERIFRDYSQQVQELERLDRFIEECCHAVGHGVVSSGSSVRSSASPQERILEAKENSKEYCRLLGAVSLVEKALATLPPQEAEMIEYTCRNGMTVEEIAEVLRVDPRTVYRAKKRALMKLLPIFFPEIPYGFAADA